MKRLKKILCLLLAIFIILPSFAFAAGGEKRDTYEIYVGEELVSEQVVGVGEYLFAPPTPKDDRGIFLGWAVTQIGSQIVPPNDYSFPFKFAKIKSGDLIDQAGQGKTVKLEAIFDNDYYVIFRKPAKNITDADSILNFKKVKKGQLIPYEDVFVETDSDQDQFSHWSTEKDKDDFAYEADFSKAVEYLAAPGSQVINLYAVIDKRLKLILDTDGGTSLLTRHVKYGEGVDSDRYGIPLNPQKPGEEFVGYYEQKPNNPIPATSIGSPIDLRTWKAPTDESIKEITLYAGYKAAKGTYNVNFYLETLDGSGNSFYSFETSTVMHDRRVGENPNWVDFPKARIPNFDIIYQLNETKSDNVYNITVSHDGRTNVNVYYDRRKYEVKFYMPDNPGRGFIGSPLSFKYGEKIPVDTIKNQYRNAGYDANNLVFGIEEPYGSRNNKDYITGAPSIGYNGLTNMNIIAKTRSQGKNFTILSILKKDKEKFEQDTMGRVLTLEDYAKTNLTVPDNINFDIASFNEKSYFGDLNVQRVDFSYQWTPSDHMYLTKVDILDFEGYTPIHPYGDEKGFPNSGIDNFGNYEYPPGNDPKRGG